MEAKDLFYRPRNGYEQLSDEEREAMNRYCEDYKQYINAARTEREAVALAVELAEKAGFRAFTADMELRPGMKIYCNNRGKSLILAHIGEKSLSEGCRIAAAHIDAPRIDLKQRPLHEDSELAYFKTHYYGGIRKYQWLAIPLELHGRVILSDASTVDISIGGGEDEPRFVITDLLPHLAAEQNKKPLAEAIPGESLSILIGSEPTAGADGERVKTHIMKILNEKYGITEKDFLSAELEAVPAFKACDVGFDRSLIGAYAHDDRVCVYAEIKAIFDSKTPEITSVCLLADKEETGSETTGGMQSEAFECFMEDLCEAQGVKLRHCFAHSVCLSADVCNAYDPLFPEVSEKQNSALLNYGMSISKYTGKKGKSGTNDADAETVAFVKRVFDENAVAWQMAELGKVDQGGGGTVARYIARRNISTIDAGVPVLSMHAPFETVAKFDCYMAYKGIKAFYEAEACNCY